MNATDFICSACGKTKRHDFSNREPFPIGWFNRQIDEYGNLAKGLGMPYLLCDACGNEGHFIGGMSPYLRDLFKKRGIVFKEGS